VCEQFNYLINKHIAGKRLNFSSKRSYNRVEAAVVSFNSKQYLRKIHKKISNCSPGVYFSKNVSILKIIILFYRKIWEKIHKKL